MKTASFLALSSFLLSSFVEAAPLNKRDMVVVTQTQEVVETVNVYTTVWVNPGEAIPTSVAAEAASTTDGGYFYEQPSSSVVAAPSTFTSVYSAPASSAAAYTPPTSSAYVAPSSSAYVAPSSVYTPPASSAAPSPSSTEAPAYTAPASSTVAAPAPSSSSTGGGGSGQYTGDITYYNPGGNTGSCGTPIADTDMAVALAAGMMGAVSNGNEWCGKKITIYHGSQSVEATIMDKCPGCAGASIDLTPAVWAAVAQGVDGRGTASWSVN